MERKGERVVKKEDVHRREPIKYIVGIDTYVLLRLKTPKKKKKMLSKCLCYVQNLTKLYSTTINMQMSDTGREREEGRPNCSYAIF